jgi:2-keto-4-pentenoate hydratase/2-oxohepta-3-ene-1,7-dioic acid hydratase in catechol pathway
MQLGNLSGRSVVITDSGAIDIAEASNGLFPADPQALFGLWTDFRSWATQLEGVSAIPFDEKNLLAPVPQPRQVFGIALNYPAHAEESGLPTPAYAHAFTKFPSAIAGPDAVVTLPSDTTIWEAELVVVVGVGGHGIDKADAWSHVAGLTIGQDLSNREFLLQLPWPQLSLGKSFPGFAPIGPLIVTPDEFADPDDLAIECRRNDGVVQKARTGEMIFGVAALISQLSSVVTMMPGDIIFTGTPAAFGPAGQQPQFLEAGDTLDTVIEGIGTLQTHFRS